MHYPESKSASDGFVPAENTKHVSEASWRLTLTMPSDAPEAKSAPSGEKLKAGEKQRTSGDIWGYLGIYCIYGGTADGHLLSCAFMDQEHILVESGFEIQNVLFCYSTCLSLPN